MPVLIFNRIYNLHEGTSRHLALLRTGSSLFFPGDLLPRCQETCRHNVTPSVLNVLFAIIITNYLLRSCHKH